MHLGDLRCMHAGHSLGGALATLASYDLKQVLPDRAQLSCYTFGAPRTGESSPCAAVHAQVGFGCLLRYMMAWLSPGNAPELCKHLKVSMLAAMHRLLCSRLGPACSRAAICTDRAAPLHCERPVSLLPPVLNHAAHFCICPQAICIAQMRDRGR